MDSGVSANRRRSDLAMVGLGVMGSNLVLNMAEHGFSLIGYDPDPVKAQRLRQLAGTDRVQTAESMDALTLALTVPRKVMLMVPAGKAVDVVLRELVPALAPGDIIIDGGNSHFTATDARQAALAIKGIEFLGVGISGGEEGARRGPSLMPGGPRDAYEQIHPIFAAIAARAHGEPCVAYLGPGSAGHYVKMVHNGIEYALMQLIAETYDLMKRGMGMSAEELHTVYAEWNDAELNGYLLEITAQIFRQEDPNTERRLIDVILDAAQGLGTGMWTSQDAMALQTPVSLIDTAVTMRNLSALKAERLAASQLLTGPSRTKEGEEGHATITQLRNALYLGMLLAYSQGMAQLRAASLAYQYALRLEDITRIWRGGCIIRSGLLEMIHDIYRTKPEPAQLLLDPDIAHALSIRADDLRRVVWTASDLGIPAPALMAALSYYDAFRSGWLPANLIQAQRDYFGAHTYERIDEHGVFHTTWR